MDQVPSRDIGLNSHPYYVVLGNQLSGETLETLIDVPQIWGKKENRTPSVWVWNGRISGNLSIVCTDLLLSTHNTPRHVLKQKAEAGRLFSPGGDLSELIRISNEAQVLPSLTQPLASTWGWILEDAPLRLRCWCYLVEDWTQLVSQRRYSILKWPWLNHDGLFTKTRPTLTRGPQGFLFMSPEMFLNAKCALPVVQNIFYLGSTVVWLWAGTQPKCVSTPLFCTEYNNTRL